MSALTKLVAVLIIFSNFENLDPTGCADMYLELSWGILTSTEILSVILDIIFSFKSRSLTWYWDLKELRIISLKVDFTSPADILGKSPIEIICSLSSLLSDNLLLNLAAIAADRINSAISPLLNSWSSYFFFFIIYF